MQDEPKKVAATLKEKLDAFKVYLPLIQALRTPGMRERHWAKLSQEVQVRAQNVKLVARKMFLTRLLENQHDIKPDQSLTLKFLLEIEVEKHLSFITQVDKDPLA